MQAIRLHHVGGSESQLYKDAPKDDLKATESSVSAVGYRDLSYLPICDT